MVCFVVFFFFFSSRRRHTRSKRDWSSDVCSSDLAAPRATDGNFSGGRRAGAGPVSPQENFGCGGASGCRRSTRSEERRVGKECRARRAADHEKKKEKKGKQYR